MPVDCPTFPARDGNAFLKELKVEVDKYFTTRGLSQKANAGMVFKTVALLSITFGSWALILWGGFSPMIMLALAAVVGLGMAGIGFAVAHDALHGAYSSNSRINHLVGCSMDMIGGSSYMWRITHNVIHHTYTNIHGTDEDLAVSPLLRLSPHAERRWFHRFRHLGMSSVTTRHSCGLHRSAPRLLSARVNSLSSVSAAVS